MTDIFREVDEEVRREKAAEFWAKYQNLIVILAVAIIVGAGGWRYWQYQQRTAAEAAGLEFQDAVRLASENKTKDAEAAFEKIAKQGASGYAALAKLRAAIELQKRDKADAAKAFAAIAADASVPPTLQEAARIRAAAILVDTEDYDAFQKRLEPLSKIGSTFRYTALELLAVSAIKAEKYPEATKWLDLLISSPAAPQSIRRRANALQGLVAGSKSAGK
ncbi:MAG: tetratricopeptide repeat protein [Hyphomicrobiales bacterium]|nr:tetratricopeptide repeat protein [Hyphomicrobiales bacterium]